MLKGRTLEFYKDSSEEKLIYFMCFDWEKFYLSQATSDRKAFNLAANKFVLQLKANSWKEAEAWKSHLRRKIIESSGYKFGKLIESRYFSEPHISMSHLLTTIKSLDLLRYKEGTKEYVGLIWIKSKVSPGTKNLTLDRRVLYYHPINKEYKFDSFGHVITTLRNLKIYRLMNYEPKLKQTTHFNWEELLKEGRPKKLNTTASSAGENKNSNLYMLGKFTQLISSRVKL